MITAVEPTEEAETAWLEAEDLIMRQIGRLGRWDAERWAAGHERQLPRISLMALRVAYMQAAIDSNKNSYLEAAFDRMETAVASLDWAMPQPGFDPEQRSALAETVLAVTEVAQHALTAVVLAREASERKLPESRRRQLALAGSRVSLH